MELENLIIDAVIGISGYEYIHPVLAHSGLVENYITRHLLPDGVYLTVTFIEIYPLAALKNWKKESHSSFNRFGCYALDRWNIQNIISSIRKNKI